MARALRILASALIIGCLLFMIIILGLVRFLGIVAQPDIVEYRQIYLAVIFVVAAACLFRAFSIYRKESESAKNSPISSKDKLNVYRATLVKYYALCEGPALFGIVLFFLSGDYLVLLVTVVMLIAMFIKYPVKKRIEEDLGLNWQESQELE